MTEAGANRRRSQRVYIHIPVQVRGASTNGNFQEDTHTLVVNAHGGLLVLAAKVEFDQKLVLRTQDEEAECRVVFVGSHEDDGGVRIGVEFAQAAPHFWRIEFPPSDWEASPN